MDGRFPGVQYIGYILRTPDNILLLILPGTLTISLARAKFYVNILPRIFLSTDIVYLKPTLVGLG